jgi:hypothetical protein
LRRKAVTRGRSEWALLRGRSPTGPLAEEGAVGRKRRDNGLPDSSHKIHASDERLFLRLVPLAPLTTICERNCAMGVAAPSAVAGLFQSSAYQALTVKRHRAMSESTSASFLPRA